MTVNGTDDGFDGFRIGLAGFENPMRDPKTEEAKRLIGQVMNWSFKIILPYFYLDCEILIRTPPTTNIM